MVNRQNLRKEVSDALVAEGFKRSDRVHSLPVDGDFSLWVDSGPIGSRADIAPFIGIRHAEIEKLRAELLGSSVVVSSGTVGANVGYVLGRGYLSWEPPTTAAEVVNTIRVGLERLRGFMSIESLVAVWDFEGAKRPGWQYSRIAAQLYRGDRAAVTRAVELARADLCKHRDEVCEQFTAFAERVAERLRVGV